MKKVILTSSGCPVFSTRLSDNKENDEKLSNEELRKRIENYCVDLHLKINGKTVSRDAKNPIIAEDFENFTVNVKQLEAFIHDLEIPTKSELIPTLPNDKEDNECLEFCKDLLKEMKESPTVGIVFKIVQEGYFIPGSISTELFTQLLSLYVEKHESDTSTAS